MCLSNRKMEALNKLRNEGIQTSISPSHIRKSSDETVEKMAETFISFFEKLEEQKNEQLKENQDDK